MKTQFQHDCRSDLATDLLGCAIALVVVWGAFTTLFEDVVVPDPQPTVTTAAVAYDLYDSVMNTDEDWQMLASR